MKGILFSIVGMVILASFGLHTADNPASLPPVLSQEAVLANGAEDIVGSWHAFPGGLMIRINRDGTATFGLDANGEAIGYAANTWFQGEQMVIEFTDYDGEHGDCATAKGVYQVKLLPNGGLSFVAVQDECPMRAAVLGSRAQLGAELIFHPVQ